MVPKKLRLLICVFGLVLCIVGMKRKRIKEYHQETEAQIVKFQDLHSDAIHIILEYVVDRSPMGHWAFLSSCKWVLVNYSMNMSYYYMNLYESQYRRKYQYEKVDPNDLINEGLSVEEKSKDEYKLQSDNSSSYLFYKYMNTAWSKLRRYISFNRFLMNVKLNELPVMESWIHFLAASNQTENLPKAKYNVHTHIFQYGHTQVYIELPLWILLRKEEPFREESGINYPQEGNIIEATANFRDIFNVNIRKHDEFCVSMILDRYILVENSPGTEYRIGSNDFNKIKIKTVSKDKYSIQSEVLHSWTITRFREEMKPVINRLYRKSKSLTHCVDIHAQSPSGFHFYFTFEDTRLRSIEFGTTQYNLKYEHLDEPRTTSRMTIIAPSRQIFNKSNYHFIISSQYLFKKTFYHVLASGQDNRYSKHNPLLTSNVIE